MKKICMYLMNGMADHEHGYLLTALSSQIKPKYEFCTVALSKEPIITMGGLKITPNYALNEINKEDIISLILIGADMQLWLNSEQEPILNLAIELLKRNVLVAGICGATLGLASKGLLDERIHTSNIEFLLTNFVKSYKGIKNYKNGGNLNGILDIHAHCSFTYPVHYAFLWLATFQENTERNQLCIRIPNKKVHEE